MFLQISGLNYVFLRVSLLYGILTATTVPSRNVLFRISNLSVPWSEALTICEAANSSLIKEIHPKALEEINFLESLNFIQVQNIWSGLWRRSDSDVYYWYDCSPSSTNVIDSGDDEQCLYTSTSSSVLYPTNCNNQYQFICQQDQGDCTFETEEDHTFTHTSGDQLTTLTIGGLSSDECSRRCLTETNGDLECWALNYDRFISECELFLADTYSPFQNSFRISYHLGSDFKRKKCFSYEFNFNGAGLSSPQQISFNISNCFHESPTNYNQKVMTQFKFQYASMEMLYESTQIAEERQEDLQLTSSQWHQETSMDISAGDTDTILSLLSAETSDLTLSTSVTMDVTDTSWGQIESSVALPGDSEIGITIPLEKTSDQDLTVQFTENLMPIYKSNVVSNNSHISVSPMYVATSTIGPTLIIPSRVKSILPITYTEDKETVSVSSYTAIIPTHTESQTEHIIHVDSLLVSTSPQHTASFIEPSTIGVPDQSIVDTFCPCDCALYTRPIVNLSQTEIAERIEKMISRMRLDKRNLSSNQRRYISMPDHRSTAQGIGYVGITVICLILIGIIALDVSNLKICFQNCKKPSPRQRQLKKSEKIFRKSFSIPDFEQRRFYVTE